jgi:hypothetical protein
MQKKTTRKATKKSTMKNVFVQTSVGSYQLSLTDNYSDTSFDELATIINNSKLSLFRPNSKGYQSPIIMNKGSIVGFLGWPNIKANSSILDKIDFIKPIESLFRNIQAYDINLGQ